MYQPDPVRLSDREREIIRLKKICDKHAATIKVRGQVGHFVGD